jgi:Fe-S cluster biogenesis protein NfuA
MNCVCLPREGERAGERKAQKCRLLRQKSYWLLKENARFLIKERKALFGLKEEIIMKEQVEAALEKIRPALKRDGGDVELIDVQDGVVKVKLTGACGGCPMSGMTLRMGVERAIKQEVREIKEVVAA